MGGFTLRVKKQDPVVDSDEYPACGLQFRVPIVTAVGGVACYGDCGIIEVSGGETKLQTLGEGEEVVVAPCGQRIMFRVDR